MSSERSLVIASAGREAEPAGDHEVGAGVDDLLGVDRGEGRDVGQGDGLGGEVAAVIGRDDPVAGTEVEQDLGRGRGQRDDLLRRGRERDGRAFVVGERDGKGRRGRRAGARQRRSRPGSRWRRPRSEMSRAPRRRSTRRGPGPGRRRGPAAGRAARPERPRRTTGAREPPEGMGLGRGRDESRNPSLRHGSKEGPNRSVARVLPTFLSKVRACTVWSATGLALSSERSP